MPGIRLLNTHCKNTTNLDYSSKGERLKNWLSTQDIYIKILTKDITEVEYDQSKYILSLYGKSYSSHEKTNELLKMLRDNDNQNKLITKFCLKKMEIYPMS